MEADSPVGGSSLTQKSYLYPRLLWLEVKRSTRKMGVKFLLPQLSTAKPTNPKRLRQARRSVTGPSLTRKSHFVSSTCPRKRKAWGKWLGDVFQSPKKHKQDLPIHTVLRNWVRQTSSRVLFDSKELFSTHISASQRKMKHKNTRRCVIAT